MNGMSVFRLKTVKMLKRWGCRGNLDLQRKMFMSNVYICMYI